ncbi:protein CPR-5 [Sesamum angolense]|uniref:Protein CPR-5 n=1 Tax=Sesamum angolense TaxID=2727404 RepID=A0AAE1XH16_9LAMI|nr:protein CPR-5 [Sesamum angolense]
MDAHHHHPTVLNGTATVIPPEEIPPDLSSFRTIDDPKSATTIAKRKNRKKKQTLGTDSASSASSSNRCCETSSLQKGLKILRNPRRVRVGSLTTTRRRVDPSELDALGLPLGMSIAAVVAQFIIPQPMIWVEFEWIRHLGFGEKNAAGEKMSVDHLSGICILAVRESLGNVFGDKFDNFVTNFEKSFRSTLMTLRLISDSSQSGGQLQGPGFRGSSSSTTRNFSSPDKLKDSACTSGATDGLESLHHRSNKEQHQTAAFQDSASTSPDRIEDSAVTSGGRDGLESLSCRSNTDRQCCTSEQMEENAMMNLMNRQLILHDIQPEQQLACVSASTSSFNSGVNQTMLSTIEKSVTEQTRSNDLKTFEIGLIMKKLQLKERQLTLNSDSNLLERWKLSMGFSKASFKAEKFKTQLQDTRQVELLRKCLDFLVAGLIMMLVSLAYGTYVYSYRRIIEATEVCSPFTVLERKNAAGEKMSVDHLSGESKSWWMPKSMATFNSGLQLLRCQVQVFSRMLFGALMIGAIAVLLIQRSATSHQAMPVTVILLLLGVVCGYAGKFCVDMLGGSGNHWLIYWEALCLLHFFSNTFHSILYFILNGPITVAEKAERSPIFPYWMRRSMFYATLLVLPLLCGFMLCEPVGISISHTNK